MSSQWPQIHTGGSLLLAWQLKHKHILIVGGGNVAADRIRSVLAAWDATTQSPNITLVCPSAGLGEEVRFRLAQEEWNIHHVDRPFQDQDLQSKDLVLTATDDEELSKHIHSLCKQQRIIVNVADVPPLCDFYFGSIVQRGPLQIMVSTNGKSPRLANRIRRNIQESLPDNVDKAISGLGKLRAELRQRSKDQKEAPRRMSWMVDQTDAWTMDQLTQLDDRPEWRTQILDQGWRVDGDRVVSYEEVQSSSGLTGQLWCKVIRQISHVDWWSVAAGASLGGAIASAACLRLTKA